MVRAFIVLTVVYGSHHRYYSTDLAATVPTILSLSATGVPLLTLRAGEDR